jgi:hypothetical protein
MLSINTALINYDLTVQENAILLNVPHRKFRRYLHSNGLIKKFKSAQLNTSIYRNLRYITEYAKNPAYCSNPFCIKPLTYPQRHNKYCCSSCSGKCQKRKQSVATKQKLSTLAKTRFHSANNWHVFTPQDVAKSKSTRNSQRITKPEQLRFKLSTTPALVPNIKPVVRNTKTVVRQAKPRYIKTYLLSCKNCTTEFEAKKSTKLYCSLACSYKSPKLGGARKGSGHSKSGYYQGIYCGSTWEIAWVIYCIDHQISFARNTERFSYHFNGTHHEYIPDFILKDGTYLEIKGYSTDQWIAKQAAFPKALIVIGKKEISTYIKYVKKKYSVANLVLLYQSSKHKQVANCVICKRVCSGSVCSSKCSGKLLAQRRISGKYKKKESKDSVALLVL